MSKSEQRIIDYLSQPEYKPVTRATLAQKMKLKKKHKASFHAILDQLIEQRIVRVGKKSRLRLREAKASGLIGGVIKRTNSGSGYLIPHERTPELQGEDVYIAPPDMRDAHTGDEVLVSLTARRRRSGQRCGRVAEVLERASNTFVGTYFEDGGRGFVRVDGTTFRDPVSVGDPGAKGANPDDKVVIEMLRFPSLQNYGEAVLIQVLGPRGKPGIDTLTVIHEFGLPHEFSDKVMAAASLEAENFDETQLEGRLDLTGEVIVTIDPADARDFDDAISLKRTDDGHWHLGVHIADVAHFVRSGSLLDIEAQKRGTSVYLPNRVIPMLPEVISNGLASLQQGKVRFTKSAFIEFSPDGLPLHTKFANSAIKVTQRFAYEQVLPIIEKPAEHSHVTKPIRDLLVQMHKLAMMLRKRRFKQGALHMGLPEVRIDFNKKGEVTGAHEAHHDESHEVIEEFMLAANIAVATKFAEMKLGYLRRTHGEPSEPKLKSFSDFVNGIGFELKKYQSRRDLQALLDSVRDKPQERAVNFAFLRSLKQAEYSPLDTGHYALSVTDYCHFTSPIRRYPDLMVHRLFDEIVRNPDKPHSPSAQELMKLGRQCSLNERRAERAERTLKKIKLLTYMSTRVGDEFDAVITGVESFGIFVQTMGVPAEGFIHVSGLTDDSYNYDAQTWTLTGFRKGNVFQLGDHLVVRVARVDIDQRELDFALVKKTASVPQATRIPSKPKKKRKQKSSKKNSTPKKSKNSRALRKKAKAKTSSSAGKRKRSTTKKAKKKRKRS